MSKTLCPLSFVPIKRSQEGWYPAIVVARVSDHLSHSTCLEMLHPKTDERVNPQCGGAPSCWKIIHGSNSSNWGATECFLVINVCNQGKNLCSPCVFPAVLFYNYEIETISFAKTRPDIVQTSILIIVILELLNTLRWYQRCGNVSKRYWVQVKTLTFFNFWDKHNL